METLTLLSISRVNAIVLLNIIVRHLKVKGDMLVMENISRKKNKKEFEELEKFLNEYKR